MSEDTKQLPLSQRIALDVVQRALTQTNDELGKAKQKADQALLQWRAVMVECGLDLNKAWRISPDGTAEEQAAAPPAKVSQRMAAPLPPPSGNGQLEVD